MTSIFKNYLIKLSKSFKLTTSSIIEKVNKMIDNQIANNNDDSQDEPDLKRQKISDKIREFPYQKKKVALLIIYSGKGYLGMQRNPGYKTIEGDLLEALCKSGVVRPEHIEQPGPKMAFQRAARTDKGVSAAGQVVSLKMFIDVENPIEKINNHLSPQIRAIGLVKVTKGFDSKKSCDARTYSYLTPTFAFAPINEKVTEDYRITDTVLSEVQHILNFFIGTHNFHNFTSGKKPTDASAKRYIKEFKIGKPFIKDSMEHVTLTVKGQSFMIHHIRKMTGLTMAIMRGYANLNTIEQCWKPDKVDVPKAPSLGLMLEQLHYDSYNKKFGNDGFHQPVSWLKYHDTIEKFKNEFIYPTVFQGELLDKQMLKWLSTLQLHSYEENTGPNRSPLITAWYLANNSSPSHNQTSDVTSISVENNAFSDNSSLNIETSASEVFVKEVFSSSISSSGTLPILPNDFSAPNEISTTDKNSDDTYPSINQTQLVDIKNTVIEKSIVNEEKPVDLTTCNLPIANSLETTMCVEKQKLSGL